MKQAKCAIVVAAAAAVCAASGADAVNTPPTSPRLRGSPYALAPASPFTPQAGVGFGSSETTDPFEALFNMGTTIQGSLIAAEMAHNGAKPIDVSDFSDEYMQQLQSQIFQGKKGAQAVMQRHMQQSILDMTQDMQGLEMNSYDDMLAYSRRSAEREKEQRAQRETYQAAAMAQREASQAQLAGRWGLEKIEDVQQYQVWRPDFGKAFMSRLDAMPKGDEQQAFEQMQARMRREINASLGRKVDAAGSDANRDEADAGSDAQPEDDDAPAGDGAEFGFGSSSSSRTIRRSPSPSQQ